MRDVYGASCYGTDETQVEDCVRLGATILQHVGTLDLTWSNLVPDTGDASYVRGLPVQTSRREVIDQINTLANRARIARALRALHERNVRVILTCFPWAGRDHADEFWGKNGMAEALWLPWSPDHAREDLLTPYQASDNPHLYEIFDARSDYQVAFMSYIAEGIAALLISVAGELSSPKLDLAAEPFEIGEVVAGLEMFNRLHELNVILGESCSVEFHPERLTDAFETVCRTDASQASWKCPAIWAVVWWQCVATVLDTLGAAGVELPIHLPGIASYYEELDRQGRHTRHSLAYSLEFLREFVQLVALIWLEFEGHPINDFVAGVNYEWDHRGRAKAAEEVGGSARVGPRHIGHLAREVALIGETLAGDVGLDIKILVMDTGISVADTDEFYPTWMPDPEEFQAYEVWRRLCGALAAGAWAAGWEAWMSLHNSSEERALHIEKYVMGLREDDIPKDAVPAAAVPRLSWVAFQRLTQLLGEVTHASLVHPTVSSSSEFSPAAVDELVILRFRYRAELGGVAYAWVILPDATADEASAWQLTGEWAGAEGTIEHLPTEPSSVSEPYGADTSGNLHVVDATYLPYPTPSMPLSLRVRPGRAPIFYRSDKPVRWTVALA